MRAFLLGFVVVAGGLGAIAASSPAQAWYDHWGRWHPNRHYPHSAYYHGYYRPPVYYHHHAYYGHPGYYHSHYRHYPYY